MSNVVVNTDEAARLYEYATGRSLSKGFSPRREFILEFYGELMEMFQTMCQKNADYAQDSDPWGNLRAAEELGIPMDLGILLRMQDKWVRLRNIVKKGGTAVVEDESLDDTLLDLAVYALFVRMAHATHRRVRSVNDTFEQDIKEDNRFKDINVSKDL